MTSLFISYSRKDMESARKLTEAFKGQGLDFWIDWEGIPPTVDWWSEIENGIEGADIFIFLISPDSIKSKICKQEIEHARKNGKRLIPIVVRDIKANETPSDLGHLNWVFLRESDDFSSTFDKLITAIKTDFGWVQVHRRLQVKALEWERGNYENSFLLRGKELQDAELQLASNSSKEPHPTDLQREYVLKSRQSSDKQRRTLTIVTTAGVIALAMLTVFGLVQAGLATKNAVEAQKQAEIARARELAAVSITNLNFDPELSLHLAMQSINSTYTLQGEDALRRALISPPVELTLHGHSGAIYSVSFDHNGQRLATASEDGTARIWDASTGQELMVLRGHIGAVYDAVFDPDDQLVVTVGEDMTVRIWDADTGELANKIDKHSGAVNTAAFSPDGQYLVTASADNTARVWDVNSGSEIHILTHNAEVRAAAFSPDGTSIATGGYDQMINIWDANTGELTQSLPNAENVNSIAFSPDSQHVLITWGYNTRRWDILNEFVATQYIGGHTWYVTSVTFNPSDGRQVVTASRDHTVCIWDTESGNPIEVLRGHSGVVYDVAFDPNGDHLATASEDQTVRIWNIAEWRKRILIGNANAILGAAYSFDGSQIATTSEDGTIRIWDAQSGKELSTWQYPYFYATGVSFSPDNQQLITASDDGTWRIWDVKTGEQVYMPDTITNIVHDARFNHDGTRIITTNRDNFGYIWDAKTKLLLARLEGHKSWVASGMFSPDGQLVVTASADGTARLWEAQTGTELRVFSGHSDLVLRAAFSSDTKRIVTASVDGTARIWDTYTGETLHVLRGHLAEVTDATFSPDDKLIATSSRDDTVRLWDAETGDEITQLLGHTKDLRTVTFSPDGRYLLTTSLDGTARIYSIHFEDVLALARSLLSPRELTCPERVKYLHEEILCPTLIPDSTLTP